VPGAAPTPGHDVRAESPPPAFRVPAGDIPTGVEPARAILVERLREAPEGSRLREDLSWLLELGRRFGPDAPGVPEGRARTVSLALRINAWWYARRGAPTRRVVLREPEGIILNYREGHGFAVNPVATTGRWQGLNDDVPPEALAGTLLTLAVERRGGGRRFLAWEYYDVADEPQEMRPGISGMAQGRLAELLAGAWRGTGDVAFLGASLEALTALDVDVDDGGARALVSAPGEATTSPWYVERAYPGAGPWKGAALNGFMVTLLSLRNAADLLSLPADPGASAPPPPVAEPPDEPPAEDAAEPAAGAQRAAEAATEPGVPQPLPEEAATASALAGALADRGAETLRRYLPLHDSGSWSYYGMLTPMHPWRSDLADLNYHCYHVALLERLAWRWPGRGFADVAARWAGYVDRAGATCPRR